MNIDTIQYILEVAIICMAGLMVAALVLGGIKSLFKLFIGLVVLVVIYFYFENQRKAPAILGLQSPKVISIRNEGAILEAKAINYFLLLKLKHSLPKLPSIPQ